MGKKGQVWLYLGLILVVVFLAIQTIADVKSEYKKDKKETSEIASSESQDAGISEEEWLAHFNKSIEELRVMYPDGKFWNHMDVGEESAESAGYTEIPCNHNENYNDYCNAYIGKSNDAYPYAVAGRQSVGFASMISDYIFGEEADAYSFTEFENVRVGDQARIDSDTHTVFIIEKTDEYIIVAEVNADGTCEINWDRKIEAGALKDALYISRYEK